MIRFLITIALVMLATACTTQTVVHTNVSSYDSIELSVGVIRLINTSRGRPVALENDDRIMCVDLNPPGHPNQSRFCQTRDEFNTSLDRGKDLIHSINSNTQP